MLGAGGRLGAPSATARETDASSGAVVTSRTGLGRRRLLGQELADGAGVRGREIRRPRHEAALAVGRFVRAVLAAVVLPVARAPRTRRGADACASCAGWS